MGDDLNLIDYYAKTHATRVYGTSSVKYIRYLRPWITLKKPRSVLDFGCGQSIFLDVLGLDPAVELLRYDPAIPAYAQKPGKQADLLINIDVLEHIEEDDLDPVIEDMRASCRDAIMVIDTIAANHTLPDGSNAHCTIKPISWWRERLGRHFGSLEAIKTPRRTRAAFKTWSSSPAERRAYAMLRAKEELVYNAKRLIGRHKQHWKVSSTD